MLTHVSRVCLLFMGTKSPKGSNFFRQDVCNCCSCKRCSDLNVLHTFSESENSRTPAREKTVKASACAPVHAAASVMSHLSWVNPVNELEKGQKNTERGWRACWVLQRPLTDSEWHVVFSSSLQASAVIQPCAHHILLLDPGFILTQTPEQPSDLKTKLGKTHQLHLGDFCFPRLIKTRHLPGCITDSRITNKRLPTSIWLLF